MSTSVVLMQADIFFGIDRDRIERIAEICCEKVFHDDQLIFEENSSGDELYVIARGEVEICVDPALVSEKPELKSKSQTIARLRRGQSFGEIALVDQGIRSATARSVNDETRLLVIPRQALLDLCEEDPNLGYHLMRNLAADLAMKLRCTDFQIRDRYLKEK
jgi:CRP/FNR family cyclic AMP-dependent transcriptional regulator